MSFFFFFCYYKSATIEPKDNIKGMCINSTLKMKKEMHLCFLDSVFTRSRVSYTCSGDLSRFGKLVDLHTKNFSSKLLHCLFLSFSVNLVFVEKNSVMVFWKFGKTQKSPLSQKLFLEMYFFSYCF